MANFTPAPTIEPHKSKAMKFYQDDNFAFALDLDEVDLGMKRIALHKINEAPGLCANHPKSKAVAGSDTE